MYKHREEVHDRVLSCMTAGPQARLSRFTGDAICIPLALFLTGPTICVHLTPPLCGQLFEGSSQACSISDIQNSTYNRKGILGNVCQGQHIGPLIQCSLTGCLLQQDICLFFFFFVNRLCVSIWNYGMLLKRIQGRHSDHSIRGVSEIKGWCELPRCLLFQFLLCQLCFFP